MAGSSAPIGGSWFATIVYLLAAFLPFIVIFGLPHIASLFGSFLGWTLKKKTEGRKAQLTALMSEEGGSKGTPNTTSAKATGKGDDFDGIIGFFHPFW